MSAEPVAAPKKKAAKPTLSELDVVAAGLNAKFGAGTVVRAGEVHAFLPRITTGSLSLDLILGGGWPANQWVEIIGVESSGKTAIALKTIAANQAINPEFTAVWIAAESWVPRYAEMCGVDLSRVWVVDSNIMEEAYSIAIAYAESRATDCIVIDSLPALIPAAEDENDMEGSTVGRGALLTGKFFRKVGMATKRSLTEDERPVLGIVINQWRSKIGIMFGDPRTSPGGQGKDYAYFVKLEAKRDEWIEIGEKNAKERVGQTIKIRTTKNKTSPPQQVAYIDFYFKDKEGGLPPGAYDFAKEVASIAVLYDVVTRAGSWYRFDGDQWQGFDKFTQAIREDPDLYDKLKAEAVAVVEAVAR